MKIIHCNAVEKLCCDSIFTLFMLQVDKFGSGKMLHISAVPDKNGKNVVTVKDDQSGTMIVISNPYG